MQTEKTEGGVRKARFAYLCKGWPLETSYFYILIPLFCTDWPISRSPCTGRSSPYQDPGVSVLMASLTWLLSLHRCFQFKSEFGNKEFMI